MSDDPVLLDEHRGMAAQKATDMRRRRSSVRASHAALERRAAEIEAEWAASPAASWEVAVEKASYLLALLAASPVAQEPRRQRLIAQVLEDFKALLGAPQEPPAGK